MTAGVSGAVRPIWNNIKLVFGGLGVARDLEDLSVLCGDRIERSRATFGQDMRRSTTVSERTVRVLPANLIRQLPDGQALVLRRNTPPVIGRIRPVWDRPDVRRARKAGVDPLAKLVVTEPVWEPAESADNVIPLSVAACVEGGAIPLPVATRAEESDGETAQTTATSS